MRRLLLVLLFAWPAWCATALTTVQGTVLAPNGAGLNGKVYIIWQRFTAAGGEIIPPPARPLEVPITSGGFTVQLIPNDTATPAGTAYTVWYSFFPGQQEHWSVPTSATPVNASAIATTGTVDSTFIVALTQLASGGATTGQCMVWNGYWQPSSSCGGGGGGGSGNVTAGGTLTSGQLIAGAGGSAIAVGNLAGDTTTSGTLTTTTAKVNGVAYPASPATNSVPVVMASNSVSYRALPTGGTNGCAGTNDKVVWNSATQSWGCGVDNNTGGGGGGATYTPDAEGVVSIDNTAHTIGLMSEIPRKGGASVWTGSNNFATAAMIPPYTTVASLPSAVSNPNRMIFVQDCESSSSCTVGGGTSIGLAYSNGTVWLIVNSANVTMGSLPAPVKVKSCAVGMGMTGTGSSTALASGSTYIVSGQCVNDFGSLFTITAIKCFADGGAATGNVADNSGNGLLTGAITGSPSWATGTQSATTTIAANAWMNFTFTGDGTTKQIVCRVIGTI